MLATASGYTYKQVRQRFRVVSGSFGYRILTRWHYTYTRLPHG